MGQISNGLTVLPTGFYYDDSGWLMRQVNESQVDFRVCSWLEVEARTRDTQGSNYGYLLHWLDDDGRDRRWAMPAELLVSDGCEYRRTLLMRGMRISNTLKARQALSYFIQRMGELTQQRIYSVAHIGWHQNSYIHPLKTLSPPHTKEQFVLQTSHPISGMQCFATSNQWRQTVGIYCQNNPMLMLCVCASLAAPLLTLCSVDGFGLHLTGASSIGKTAALFPALSIWGQPSKLCQSWRATANGLEGTALARNDSLLALDEMGEVDAKEIGDIAYMLANGQAKIRADADGNAKSTPRWNLIFLSTGEVTLESHLASMGKRIKAGQEVRVIDINADMDNGFGVFTDTHGLDAAELADRLKVNAKLCCGCIALDWLGVLVNHQSDVLVHLRGMKKRFLQDIPDFADGQVKRVAEKFALLALAGELAIQWRVLDWKIDSVFSACQYVFSRWLTERGGVNAGEDMQAILHIRSFIEQYGESRFSPVQSSYKHIIQNRAGWIDNREGRHIYCFYPTGWREAIQGLSSAQASTALIKAVFLITDGGKAQRKVSLPDNSRPRMYCVKSEILGG